MPEHPSEIMKIDASSSSLTEHINPRNIIDLLRTEFSGPNSMRMSPINSTERQFVKTIAEEIRKRETYFVSLCRDVLLEVLCYGDRRWLTKLERVGQRFHWMAENFFSARPFLRIDLSLKLNYSRNKMETLINHKQISLTNLANFPSFIRFRDVTLIYNYYYYNSPQPIAEKCELITSYLQVLKPALYDTRILRFHGTIDHRVPYYFSDHSQLLCHLRDQLLPICGNARRYKFKIMFNTDKDAGGSVISSILQMPQIIRCSDVFIQPTFYSDEFPIEDISNWLHQKNTDGVGVGVENVGQKETQRFLQLDSCIIPNAQEMYKHLKKKFEEAETRGRLYVLTLTYFNKNSDVEEQIVPSERTNEVFSVEKKGYQVIVTKKKIANEKEKI